jgi:hypothetical protein
MKKIIAITPDHKHDYLASTIIEGMQLLGCEILASDVGNGISLAHDDKTLIREARDADMIVVFFGKVRDNKPPKRYLLSSMSSDRVAYIDGSEWTASGNPMPNQVVLAKNNPSLRRGDPWIDEQMRSLARWYYKRECYPQDTKDGIIPLPFGIIQEDQVENTHKDIDILCSFGQTNDGLRSQVLEYCKELSKQFPKLTIFTDSGLEKRTYKDILRRSKIVIDAWGGGDCCARIWESIGHGACCVRQKYNIVIPHEFENRKQIMNFSSISEFKDVIADLLSSPELLASIAENGKNHGMMYHTSRARALYMLENAK